MNRLLILGLLGAGLYWLLREPASGGGYREYGIDDDTAEGGSRQIGGRPDPMNEDDLLDEAIKESFPASDPPALSR